MQRLLPTLVLGTACALAACALPSMASEIHTSKKPTPTTTKLKESASSIKENGEFGMSATVSPSKATGKVIFYGKGLAPATGWIDLAELPLVHGVASGTKKFNRVGNFEFKAVYQGSSSYEKSTSNYVYLVSK